MQNSAAVTIVPNELANSYVAVSTRCMLGDLMKLQELALDRKYSHI